MQTQSSLENVTKLLVSTALGREKADLVLKNANLVDVYTGELLEGTDVAIKGDRIALVGKADHTIGAGTTVLDVNGKYLAPGFLDGHVHIDDSMVTVTEFARVVLPRGTTGVFMDPHEIANVLGLKGVRLMLDEAKNVPLRVFTCVPSCVPSTSPEFETAGAEIGPREVEEALGWDGVVGLAEMMNYPGVLSGDDKVHDEIQVTLKAGKVVEGHSDSILDAELSAYAAAGITSDHESIRKIDGLQRARLGMYAMVREGYASIRNLAEVIKIVTEDRIDPRRVILVTDDRHPRDLVTEGHMDHVVRRAIEEGVDPVTAIQMATLNTAEHYGVDRDVGGIAPSKYADMAVLDNLSKISVSAVIAGGVLVAKDGKLTVDLRRPSYPEYARRTVRVKRPLTANDFVVRASLEEGHVKAHVIGVGEKITTRHLVEELPVKRGSIQPSVEKDTAKIAVIERHRLTGNIGLGFVKGFGFREGATASTIAHDSHNLLVVGLNDQDMALAANKLVEVGGGIAVVNKEEILGLVELPIAGLMSTKSVEEVHEEVKRLESIWAGFGCRMATPFPTIVLLALPVVPELRITDKGLIDTVHFKKLSSVEAS